MPTTRTLPRSLHVLASNDRRGAEVFGVDLAGALSARGAEAHTVALVESRNDARLDVPSLGRGLDVRTLWSLRRHYDEIDVVVAHGSTGLPAAALTTIGGPPFVYRSIGDPRHWSATGLRRLRTRAFLRRAAGVVVLWPVIADVLHHQHGIAYDRIHVVPNAVDAERFPVVTVERRAEARAALGLTAAGAVVAAVGALSKEKDLGTAIRAVARLPDAHLLLAGDGPARSRLEHLAEEVAPGRVQFLGSVSDPASVLAVADVVVLSSRTEGLPGALIEAGMSGLPVVATDVGGVREVVVDGETGLVVEAGDPVALAGALQAASADAGAMGAAARRRCVARFDLPVVVDAWAEVLTAVSGA